MGDMVIARAIIRYALGLFLVGLLALLVIDGDPIGIFTGRIAARSSVLETFDVKELSSADRGLVYFAFGDFSGLSSDTLRVSAAPWTVTTAALALHAADGNVDRVSSDLVSEIFRGFGFHTPREIGNWPADLPRPELPYPLGQNVGTASRLLPPIAITIGNFGCPACHSSVMYDKNGRPDPTHVWLGAPNTSINLQAYTDALYDALRTYTNEAQDDLLWHAIEKLHPELSARERLTLEFAILPLLRRQLAELEATIGRLLPYRGSLAGATNGLDSLRARLNLIPPGSLVEKSVFNSVPDLGGRLYRDRFLNTGAYTTPGHEEPTEIQAENITPAHRRRLAAIVAYFTVPSMGVTPETAISHIGDVEDVMAWMAGYRPQPFPRQLDRTLLAEGRDVYAAHCASCHGVYDDNLDTPRIVSFPNWLGDVGTDPRRLELFGQDVADALNQSVYGVYIHARTSTEYSAPPLTGLWASAPYFHNGSVPTLRALMYADERPQKFKVGGHAVDLDTVGIAGAMGVDGEWHYPPDVTPWSTPAEVDTTAFGLGNDGHEAEFTPLNDAEKRALLEYLKAL